jgi:penicillin-binding protein A
VNRPIRRVSLALGILILALLVNLNWVQVVKSHAYRSDPANRRVLLDEYSRQRGTIIVDGKPVALSVKSTDRLKYLRTYPGGAMYAPLTGFYSLLYGQSALESVEDGVLSGSSEKLLGNRIADLLTGRDPRGGNVELTINAAAQDAAYRSMAKQKGAVVAVDPSTGAILAAVSTPSFNPAVLSSHNPDKIASAWRKLKNDPNQPMLNRAFDERYPPGSVFKVVVSAAALAAGRKPDARIAAPDRYRLPGTASASITNFDGERCGDGKTDTLVHALTISCNTAFAKLGVDLGDSAVRDEAAKFGINDQPRVCPLPVAASTLGPMIDQAALAQSSIGQRDVRITPLQAAMISAAVANNGALMEPYLVKQEFAPNLSVLSPTPAPHQLAAVLSPELDDQLKTMMQSVVQVGTGTAAQIPGVTVAGKTGTADTGQTGADGKPEPPDAWFSGFAPVTNAKIAVAVLIENGGVAGNETTGGKAAAPIAAAVMKAYLDDTKGR